MTTVDDDTVDDAAVIAEFSGLADAVRSEFAQAVSHLSSAVALTVDHRRRHDALMQRLALEYPAPGRVIVENTRMVDLTSGRLDIRPVNPMNLVAEAAAAALAAHGLAAPGPPIDIGSGPSKQIR